MAEVFEPSCDVAVPIDRIARLVEHLKGDTAGQYFLTTHSPVVLRELTVDDIHIVHCREGKTAIVAANEPAIGDCIQGKIRLGAEAFLAPKIIVCEGATEVGLLRGLDDYWIAQNRSSFAYQGVALFDADGASKVKQLAASLRHLSYDVAVLADSDAPQHFSDASAKELVRQNVTVVKWDGALSLEERAFADIPWRSALASFELACSIAGDRARVIDQVGTQYGGGFNRDPAAWTETPQMRTALGRAAKAGDGWFKRQDHAQDWAAIICRDVKDPAFRRTDLVRKLRDLRTWIDRA